MSSLALREDFDVSRLSRSGRTTNTPACAPQGIVGRFLARIAAAFERSREHRVEREAGRFIATHGGRLTDDVERQLTEHFNGGRFSREAPPRPFRPFLQA